MGLRELMEGAIVAAPVGGDGGLGVRASDRRRTARVQEIYKEARRGGGEEAGGGEAGLVVVDAGRLEQFLFLYPSAVRSAHRDQSPQPGLSLEARDSRGRQTNGVGV